MKYFTARALVAFLIPILLLSPMSTHVLQAAIPVPGTFMTVPLVENGDLWRPLYSLIDRRMQNRLEKALDRNPLWKNLINHQKMSVGIVDLGNPATPRYARVNGLNMMYAASLPKIAILLAAFVSFEDGSLPETTEIYEDLSSMIRVSSNSSATRMIDRIGFEKIARVLTDHNFKFFDPERGGGLWVGKRYAKSGDRHPDPLKGLSHAASVTQVCRFYYLLASGKIINPERSSQMLAILSDPGLHHKFVGALDKCAPKAKLFRKSGTWKDWHSDSVLVVGEGWQRYILVGMVESEHGEKILRDLVPVVEDIIRTSKTPMPLRSLSASGR